MDLQKWRQKYDLAEVCISPLADETAQWARCYASDLSRAQATARAMWSGEIITCTELREVEFAPFATGRLRLPVMVWRTLIRASWMLGHTSQRYLRDDFRSRVKAMADLIDSGSEDVLIVSHAGMMIFLRKELMRRGFRGPKFGVADHAQLYIFERSHRKHP